MQEEHKPKIELTEAERDWFNEMGNSYKLIDKIYAELINAPSIGGEPAGRFSRLHCYAIAQKLTLDAAGFLEYHEGTAFDKIEQTTVRHAWNTIHGEIVDWSWPPSMYRDHQANESFSFAKVNAAVSDRNGIWDWLNNPER